MLRRDFLKFTLALAAGAGVPLVGRARERRRVAYKDRWRVTGPYVDLDVIAMIRGISKEDFVKLTNQMLPYIGKVNGVEFLGAAPGLVLLTSADGSTYVSPTSTTMGLDLCFSTRFSCTGSGKAEVVVTQLPWNMPGVDGPYAAADFNRLIERVT